MLQTFKNAFSGLWWAIKSERNMKIHFVAIVVVCFSGFYFKIAQSEWAALVICIGLVISTELLNTAIEKMMDLMHPESSPKVKVIKDVAAGAVLFASISTVIVAILVFHKYI
ncbi:MAG: diacylglycerol kinase [Bacteroidia bacterium]|jgi:diacylglycerol kinase